MDPVTQEIELAAFEKLPDFLEKNEGIPFTLEKVLGGTQEWENNYRKHAPAGRVFYNRIEATNGCILDGWHIRPLRGGRLQMYVGTRVNLHNENPSATGKEGAV